MAWFRLDDDFANHPKVLRAGNAAVGLWVRCGTYSSRYLTDGHIDLDVARKYGRPAEIERALDARLWVQNGDGGLVMPDYLEYNPSREQVLAERAAARDRMRRRRRDSQGKLA